MNEIYTQEQWHNDRSFAAKAGQEVEENIYWQMYDVLPPLGLPQNEQGFTKGFRVGEPHCHQKSKKTGKFLAYYAAFGRKDGKYYFIGHMNKYGELSQEKEQ